MSPLFVLVRVPKRTDARKPDADIFWLARDIAQAPAQQLIYIENTPMFVQIAEGLGIRSILHTDYRSTCTQAALGLHRS